MGRVASQITSLTIVYLTIYSDADQRKHQSSASLAFLWGIHREPLNSPHKWPVTRKMFPFDDVIMSLTLSKHSIQHQSWPWQYLGGNCNPNNPQLSWSGRLSSCNDCRDFTLFIKPYSKGVNKAFILPFISKVLDQVLMGIRDYVHAAEHQGQFLYYKHGYGKWK